MSWPGWAEFSWTISRGFNWCFRLVGCLAVWITSLQALWSWCGTFGAPTWPYCIRLAWSRSSPCQQLEPCLCMNYRCRQWDTQSAVAPCCYLCTAKWLPRWFAARPSRASSSPWRWACILCPLWSRKWCPRLASRLPGRWSHSLQTCWNINSRSVLVQPDWTLHHPPPEYQCSLYYGCSFS